MRYWIKLNMILFWFAFSLFSMTSLQKVIGIWLYYVWSDSKYMLNHSSLTRWSHHSSVPPRSRPSSWHFRRYQGRRWCWTPPLWTRQGRWHQGNPGSTPSWYRLRTWTSWDPPDRSRTATSISSSISKISQRVPRFSLIFWWGRGCWWVRGWGRVGSSFGTSCARWLGPCRCGFGCWRWGILGSLVVLLRWTWKGARTVIINNIEDNIYFLCEQGRRSKLAVGRCCLIFRHVFALFLLVLEWSGILCSGGVLKLD